MNTQQTIEVHQLALKKKGYFLTNTESSKEIIFVNSSLSESEKSEVIRTLPATHNQNIKIEVIETEKLEYAFLFELGGIGFFVKGQNKPIEVINLSEL